MEKEEGKAELKLPDALIKVKYDLGRGDTNFDCLSIQLIHFIFCHFIHVEWAFLD